MHTKGVIYTPLDYPEDNVYEGSMYTYFFLERVCIHTILRRLEESMYMYHQWGTFFFFSRLEENMYIYQLGVCVHTTEG